MGKTVVEEKAFEEMSSEEIKKEIARIQKEIDDEKKAVAKNRKKKRELEKGMPDVVKKEKQKAVDNRKFILGGKMMLLIPALREDEYIEDYMTSMTHTDSAGNRTIVPVLRVDPEALQMLKNEAEAKKEKARRVAEAKAKKDEEVQKQYAENEKKEKDAKEALEAGIKGA